MYRNTKLANPLVHVLYMYITTSTQIPFCKTFVSTNFIICRVSVETWQLLGVVAVSGNVNIHSHIVYSYCASTLEYGVHKLAHTGYRKKSKKIKIF